MAFLVCENLEYLYSMGTPFQTAALDDVSLEIEKGELVGIIGHTGSGKSTLIQHLNGLLEPHKGNVILDGENIWTKENRKKIRQVRFAVGLCFQYPEYQIFEEDVYKEIAFGPKQMGLDEAEIDKRIRKSMEFVGLILDEPCAGLDPKGRDTILNLIKEYQSQMGNTVLFVSHSMEDVAKLCKKVIVMNKGKLAFCGSVNEVYSHGDELKKMGLNVPEITDIFLKLKASGIDCRTDIYTVEQGVEEYKRLLAGGAY